MVIRNYKLFEIAAFHTVIKIILTRKKKKKKQTRFGVHASLSVLPTNAGFFYLLSENGMRAS